jgi:NAD+ kinase
MNPLRTIGIVGRPDTPELRAPVERLLTCLHGAGVRALIDTDLAAATAIEVAPQRSPADLVSKIPAAQFFGHVDAIIAIGGDGTLISVARRAAHCATPIIGINQGRLGFLTDIAASEIERIIPAMIAGLYTEESRSALTASRNDEPAAMAFNDVVITRGSTGSMIDLRVAVDGKVAYSLRADGLIIATPTGSTAYALSAQGPIVHPGISAMLMVPVAPHALTNRPVVLPNTSTLTISLTRGQDALLHCDGQSHDDLNEGDTITVQLSPQSVHLLHPLDYNYYAMLRQKLAWGETAEKFHAAN